MPVCLCHLTSRRKKPKIKKAHLFQACQTILVFHPFAHPNVYSKYLFAVKSPKI